MVLAVEEYERLLDIAEMEQDVRDFDEFVGDDDEILSAHMVERLVSSESNIRIWREHRGLTQAQLADNIGVSKPFISMIESKQKMPSVKTLKAIAVVLAVDIDDLADL